MVEIKKGEQIVCEKVSTVKRRAQGELNGSSSRPVDEIEQTGISTVNRRVQTNSTRRRRVPLRELEIKSYAALTCLEQMQVETVDQACSPNLTLAEVSGGSRPRTHFESY